MFIPIPIRIANTLITQSKYSHDIAVDLMIGTNNFLFENPDIPYPIKTKVLEAMSHVVLWGDDIGNMMVRLYLFLMHLYQ